MILDSGKKKAFKALRRTVLLLLAACLLVWAHYSNEEYKERNDIDSASGATEMAE